MGGSSSSQSKGKKIPFTRRELELRGINVDIAIELFGNLLRTSDFFSGILGQAEGAFEGVGERLSQGGEIAGASFDELIELIQSGGTGAATPEQIRQLDEIQARENEQIDINTTQGLEQVKQELGPALGLRGGDSPVQDRGNRVAIAGIQAKSAAGQRRSEAELALPQFNLQRGQFLSGLQQDDFTRRLQLGQFAGGGALGVGGLADISRQQESLRPNISNQSKSSSITVL